VSRVYQQFLAVPEFFWEPLVQRLHDRRFAAGFPVRPGNVCLTGKVALLVIYQPTRLRPSTKNLCRHLIRKGYAPFVVSNAALSDEAQHALKPLTWRLMLRPNTGHDFGAYRDGLLTLRSWNVTLRRVLVMNDSVWYPVAPADTFIERLEAADADVTGTVMRSGRRGDFLESYCYLLKERCLDNPDFWTFWEDYRLTSNKYKVIRRGERGHSQALMRAGLSVKGVCSDEAFVAGLERFSDAELALTLRYSAFVDPKMRATAKALLRAPRDDGWHKNVVRFVRSCLGKFQFYSAFPYAASRILNYPVLKASSDPVAKAWRRSYYAAVNEGALQCGNDVVLSELRDRVESDFARDRGAPLSPEASGPDGYVKSSETT
jgi:hypothetical protein